MSRFPFAFSPVHLFPYVKTLPSHKKVPSLNPIKPRIVTFDHAELVIPRIAFSSIFLHNKQIQAIIACQKFSSAGDVVESSRIFSSLLPQSWQHPS